jgi:DNA replication initiation complex subunit (GINS family)
MRSFLFIGAFWVLGTGLAGAVDLTLQRISSIPAVPVGEVTKNAMAPPPGTSEATPLKARPSYEVTGTRQIASAGILPKTIPVPTFNQARVSFCPSVE